jgi:hypothetical protein
MIAAISRWIDRTFLELGREMRLSYLPPLMVYLAAGVSGLTAIVGTFFVKDYLGLSAAFLAALGFWAGIPWALKMPLGHLADLIWRWKSLLVYLGAALIAASLLIMIGLLSDPVAMGTVLRVETWFVISSLLAPVGYVLQDVVADAMTVEAVPRVDAGGHPLEPVLRRAMHTTMQTLGRVAIIGGGVLVSLINVYMFAGVESLPEGEKARIYRDIYAMALMIPVISVLGVALAALIRARDARRLVSRGFTRAQARDMLDAHHEPPAPNWWILGGSLAFVAFTLALGTADLRYNQEVIFLGSFTIILFLLVKLVNSLEPAARNTLLGTALVIFVFRAMPTTGPGVTWWMIDGLGFDQQFLSWLSLVSSALTLVGMFIFRPFMAQHSIAYIVGFLTIVGTLLSLPIFGMYYGLHTWTAAVTGGVVDARTIALVDTALESPLGQVSMIPMLAWIANSAPENLKATFFAVMASFTNLALSLSSLGTKYANEIFVVTREVRDPVTGVVTVPADYSQVGSLLGTTIVINFVLPMMAILFVRFSRFRSA